MLYDVTIPINKSLAVWPGDTEYQLGWTMQQAHGDSVTVGRVTMSLHTGTHADAPFHFNQEAPGIGDLDVQVFCGPAQLIDVSGRQEITIQDLSSFRPQQCPRLLLRTGGWSDHRRFPQQIPVLTSDVPPWLGDQGVKLLGLDVPSVDQIDSKDLPIHHALFENGISILESLDLTEPDEGEYELIAMPLRIVGGDGSPVRAVLRRP